MDIKKITEKITLPVAIVVAALVLAIGFYVVQYNKQESIERQQTLQLQEEREQARKEYIAKRKADCLDIYKTEGSKWNNVQGWRYNESDDSCYVTYKNPNPVSKEICQKNLESAEKISSPNPVSPFVFSAYLHCIEGTFENSF